VDVDRILSFEDKGQWRSLVNTLIKVQVQKKAGNFLSIKATIRFSERSLLHRVN
jgi:hypothetical protein